ncbi:MAG: N-acetyltransferase [Candidatus Kapabacteria bacterium]|nr:N-acetyltransferase [Candidatus Kapabacteria bacterium]
MSFKIRLVQESDASAIAEIYRPYVEQTSISFEYEAPSPTEILQRIQNITTEYPWLVCLNGNTIIGYAYAGTHRHRTAYQWSVESAIYFSQEFHSKGLAPILYKTLFSLLQNQGFHTVLAGITTPNDKSVHFHQKMGFTHLGTYTNIGFKFGKWHDTQWYQRPLNDYTTEPSTPKKFPEIVNTEEVQEIIQQANRELEGKLEC